MEDCKIISYSETTNGYLILEGNTYRIEINNVVLFKSKSFRYISGMFNSMNPNIVSELRLKAEKANLLSKLTRLYSKSNLSMVDISEINKIEVKLQSVKFNGI